MRDQTDSCTLPLSLGKPARHRNGQSGASLLPPLKPAELQELEFQRERLARRRHIGGPDLAETWPAFVARIRGSQCLTG